MEFGHNSANLNIIMDERLVSKTESKTNIFFRGTYTGCQEPGLLSV